MSKNKGNKSARSPNNEAIKKKGPHKYNAIYKMLCEKVKVLQITSQKLFEKNQRIKEHERIRNAELDERERLIAEREKKLNITEQDRSLKRSLKTDELFEYGGKQEYSEIMQQIRSIDTRKPQENLDVFDNQDEIWPVSTKDRQKSPDLIFNKYNETESGQNVFNMMRSLEPNEFSPAKSSDKNDKQVE